jgi:mRNA interferase YafQ
MREVKYTTRFQRDYKRKKSGRHGKKLDALLMETVNLLAADTPLPRRNFDHPLSGEWKDHRDCHKRRASVVRDPCSECTTGYGTNPQGDPS